MSELRTGCATANALTRRAAASDQRPRIRTSQSASMLSMASVRSRCGEADGYDRARNRRGYNATETTPAMTPAAVLTAQDCEIHAATRMITAVPTITAAM
jgi:hypothetical protein